MAWVKLYAGWYKPLLRQLSAHQGADSQPLAPQTSDSRTTRRTSPFRSNRVRLALARVANVLPESLVVRQYLRLDRHGHDAVKHHRPSGVPQQVSADAPQLDGRDHVGIAVRREQRRSTESTAANSSLRRASHAWAISPAMRTRFCHRPLITNDEPIPSMVGCWQLERLGHVVTVAA
jgi:hypothetical protein